MNKNAKFTLKFLFGAVCVALLGYFLLEYSEKNKRIRAAQISYNIKSAAQNQLAGAFANCAADSLSPSYFTEFIIHELMPLGIGWQLAENGELLSSSQHHAAELLKNHFFKTSVYSLQYSHDMEINMKIENELIKYNKNNKLSKLNLTKFDRYPSLIVYKSLRSKVFDNISPEDIEIGENKIDWPMFTVLAKRCKATPYDLHQMSRVPSDPPVRLTRSDTASTITDTMDYDPYNKASDYSMMKILFWKNLSETTAYKESIANIKTRNASIIREIIKVNEPLEKKKAIQEKAANDVIFKSP